MELIAEIKCIVHIDTMEAILQKWNKQQFFNGCGWGWLLPNSVSRQRAWRTKKKKQNNSEACKRRTCARRKFPENWKIINWQTTLKKLARSARMLPGEIFFFFLSLVPWLAVNFRPRWYWLICLKSSLAAPPHPLSFCSYFCLAYTLTR